MAHWTERSAVRSLATAAAFVSIILGVIGIAISGWQSFVASSRSTLGETAPVLEPRAASVAPATVPQSAVAPASPAAGAQSRSSRTIDGDVLGNLTLPGSEDLTIHGDVLGNIEAGPDEYVRVDGDVLGNITLGEGGRVDVSGDTLGKVTISPDIPNQRDGVSY